MNQRTHQNNWSTLDAIHLYSMDRWGRGFFSIDANGDVCVKTQALSGDRIQYSLAKVVDQAVSDGFAPPFVVRFPGIVRQRISEIHQAFGNAIQEFDYQGEYRYIYPIKVNQHSEVIKSVLDVADKFKIGLESGSKAELATVIAKADNELQILCNGFKDESIIELVFRAAQIGRNVTIVIEKLSEIKLVIDAAKKFAIVPRLGLRTKLGWQGGGHWKSSNGLRSKFGLTATEMLEATVTLRESDLLDNVHLLHFHPGSQINDVREIKSALTEVTRVYVDLVRRGVPLDTIDVGGGLAIDYTGNQNRHASSMNYTLQEYANDVVYYIQMVCNQSGVPHPNLFSESGRAVTAHHSILIVPVFDSSDKSKSDAPVDFTTSGCEQDKQRDDQVNSQDLNLQPLRELAGIRDDLVSHLRETQKANHRFLSESYHDAQQALETSLQLFVNGHLTLSQRAHAEQDFWSVCCSIREVLYQLEFIPDELLQMRDMLADTYFANFSVFQSLPDFWAIDQLFPVMPIHRLNERPDRRGVVGDITCDSDGQINCFLGDTNSGQQSLPLHSLLDNQPYWLGVFLIGAYQEALSDDHNLLGKIHSVSVDAAANLEGDNAFESVNLIGSNLQDVIEHVNHDWNDLKTKFDSACDQSFAKGQIDKSTCDQTKEFFDELSNQYTYLRFSENPSDDSSCKLKINDLPNAKIRVDQAEQKENILPFRTPTANLE